MNDYLDERSPELNGAPPTTVDGTGTTTPAEDQHTETDTQSTAHGRWHAEAGRKGAQRVHQLIEQGKLYEREHGLKRGRQRLRQLLAEGKLYEQEHGVTPATERTSRKRRPRRSSEEVLRDLLQAVLPLTRPAYREPIARLIQALEPAEPQV
jgi:hypothetical protein